MGALGQIGAGIEGGWSGGAVVHLLSGPKNFTSKDLPSRWGN